MARTPRETERRRDEDSPPVLSEDLLSQFAGSDLGSLMHRHAWRVNRHNTLCRHEQHLAHHLEGGLVGIDAGRTVEGRRLRLRLAAERVRVALHLLSRATIQHVANADFPGIMLDAGGVQLRLALVELTRDLPAGNVAEHVGTLTAAVRDVSAVSWPIEQALHLAGQHAPGIDASAWRLAIDDLLTPLLPELRRVERWLLGLAETPEPEVAEPGIRLGSLRLTDGKIIDDKGVVVRVTRQVHDLLSALATTPTLTLTDLQRRGIIGADATTHAVRALSERVNRSIEEAGADIRVRLIDRSSAISLDETERS